MALCAAADANVSRSMTTIQLSVVCHCQPAHHVTVLLVLVCRCLLLAAAGVRQGMFHFGVAGAGAVKANNNDRCFSPASDRWREKRSSTCRHSSQDSRVNARTYCDCADL